MDFPAEAADDATLIASARAGESAAFAQLFDRHYAMIHAFAYRLCLTGADADEIAQETFIKAARGLADFRGGNVRSWLYRIATNTARDLHRAATRRERLTTGAAEQAWIESSTRPADLTAVRDALAALPLDQRSAVVLVYLEGLNHAEAARVSGCAETTISWRIFRAKRQLRALLR